MDHEVFVDKTGVYLEMKIGDNKGGVDILYKEVVGMAISSSREKMWSSTIEGDEMDMDEGNSYAVKVEDGEGRGASFMGDKRGIGKKESVK